MGRRQDHLIESFGDILTGQVLHNVANPRGVFDDVTVGVDDGMVELVANRLHFRAGTTAHVVSIIRE